MKRTFLRCAACLLSLPVGANGPDPAKKVDHGKVLANIFEGIPYNEKEVGRRKIVDEKYLLVMQMALMPGQEVKQHLANSNVHMLVAEGEVTAVINGVATKFRKGDVFTIGFKTPMSMRNETKEKVSFVVWKAPNPSEMPK